MDDVLLKRARRLYSHGKPRNWSARKPGSPPSSKRRHEGRCQSDDDARQGFTAGDKSTALAGHQRCRKGWSGCRWGRDWGSRKAVRAMRGSERIGEV